MDSSPRPQRRFSRWQTTKRPFALGSVAYKAPSVIPNLQDDHKKSEIAKEKPRKVNDDKNGKIQKNHLDNSTTDSVAKQVPQSLSSVKRSSVARRLCLDTSKRKESNNVAAITDEVVQPVQEASHDGPDNFAFEEERLHQNTLAVNAGKSLTTDTHLSQELPTHHTRGNDGIISDETAHQNSKYALSNISQNTSADKPAAIQTLLSQTKPHITLYNSTQNGKEASVLIRETNKSKRPAVDDGESSSTSSTDKENKDKDSNNSDAPPVIKKLKQDGALHNLSTSTANMIIENVNVPKSGTILNNQNVECELLGARMSTLRNRNLLTSPKTLLKKRQYPVFHSSVRKGGSGKDSSMRQDKSCISESSFSKKVANKRQLPVSEIKSKHQSIIKTPPKKTSVRKSKGNHVNVSSFESKKQNKSLHKNKTPNISEAAATKSFVMPKENLVNCTDSHEAGSSGSRGGLRDRRLLPTPEEVQQKRQYPIAFYLSSRKSSCNVSSYNKHEITAKKKQKLEAASSLDQAEPSISKNMTSNMLESLNNKTVNSNKAVRITPKNSSINSRLSPKKHSQLMKQSGKQPDSTHVTDTVAKVVAGGNTSIILQTDNSLKYPDKKDNNKSSDKLLEPNYDPELQDPALTTQRTLSLYKHTKCSISYDNSQENQPISSQVINTKKPQVESMVRNAKTSMLVSKSTPSEDESKRYSLTRRPIKSSSNDGHRFSPKAEGSSVSKAAADISVQRSQPPTKNADTSWKQPQKIAHKGQPPHLKPKVNKVQTVNTKLATVTRPKVSISETVAVSQSQPKKGKLDSLALTTQPTLILASLSIQRKDVSNNSQENEQKYSQMENTERPTKKPQTESKTKHAKTSLSSSKLQLSKTKRKRYSLPRRPVTKSSNDKHCFSQSAEVSNTSFAAIDDSVRPSQKSVAFVDTSRKSPQNITYKRPLHKLTSKVNKVQTVQTKLATAKRSDVSINETVIVSQKQFKKRNLLEEIVRAEEAKRQTADSGVFLWREDGSTGSDVTTYDVILQAMVDEEDKLLDETEDDSIEHRTVKKVMGKLRRSIKTKITQVKEIKNLKHDIRQKNCRIKKLIVDIKEQQIIAQVNREKQMRHGSDQDVQMAHYRKVMTEYSQLIQLFAAKS